MKGWEPVDCFGFLYSDLEHRFTEILGNQPVFVLRAPSAPKPGSIRASSAQADVAAAGTVTVAPVPSLVEDVDDSLQGHAIAAWKSRVAQYIQRQVEARNIVPPAESGGQRLNTAWTLFPGDSIDHRCAHSCGDHGFRSYLIVFIFYRYV